MATEILAVTLPCIKCKHTERSKTGECRQCKSRRDAAYRALNKDKATAYHLAYYAENREKLKAAAAARLEENRSAINKKERERYAKANHWREKNPEQNRKAVQKYLAANREKRRIYEHNRRARKRQAGGEITPGLSERLFGMQKGMCPCCRLPLGADYHMDHIVPLALGGSNDDSNFQLLRSTCNLTKNAKHPIDFMQSRGFLL